MHKNNDQAQGRYQAPYQGQYQPPYPEGQPTRVNRTKNGFLAFCFAFVPGAGQMYLGYFKRGLTLVSLFAVSIGIGAVIYPLIAATLIVWMYAFFDTFDLRGRIALGTAPEDDYLVHLSDLGLSMDMAKMNKKIRMLLGWALILLGGWALLDNVILEPLYDLCSHYEIWWLYNLLHDLPALVLMVALIAVGIWLVRGPRYAEPSPDQDIHYYAPDPAASPDPDLLWTAPKAAPQAQAEESAANAPAEEATEEEAAEEEAAADAAQPDGEVQ